MTDYIARLGEMMPVSSGRHTKCFSNYYARLIFDFDLYHIITLRYPVKGVLC